jgi:phospholipid transport system transporter-binding protein
MDDVRLEDSSPGTWKLAGELGFATVSGLLKNTPRSFFEDGDIRLDLSGVTRADSAGLALLVEWLRESGNRGRSIVFLHMPEQMLSIARVCGLEEILFGDTATGAGEA